MNTIHVLSASIPDNSPLKEFDSGTILVLNTSDFCEEVKISYQSGYRIISVTKIIKSIYEGSLSASLPELGYHIPDQRSICDNILKTLQEYNPTPIAADDSQVNSFNLSEYPYIILSLDNNKKHIFIGYCKTISKCILEQYICRIESNRDESHVYGSREFILDQKISTKRALLEEQQITSKNDDRSSEYDNIFLTQNEDNCQNPITINNDDILFCTRELSEDFDSGTLQKKSLSSINSAWQISDIDNEEINIEMFVNELRNINEDELRRVGLSEAALRFLFGLKPTPSHITINRHAKIILNDYNDMEVKMDDKTKALYFLYLRHPEGIAIKDLPDHIDELMDLYQSVSGRDNLDTMRSTIVNLTDPFQNNANISLSRIKRAFCELISPTLALNYYISGERGEARKILLDRNLVNWETIRS